MANCGIENKKIELWEGRIRMKKGKLGVTYTFYAVLAFVFAMVGLELAVLLTLGVVLLYEKDEWASRQVMQALFLCVASTFVSGVFSGFSYVSSWNFVGGVFNSITRGIGGIINLVIFVFLIIGLLNVMKGKEAGLPLVSNWAYKAYGYVKNTEVPTYTAAPQQPVQPPVPNNNTYAPVAQQPQVPQNVETIPTPVQENNEPQPPVV